MKLVEAMRYNPEISKKVPTLTIEQIKEIDEYHKQGKIHPLESSCPSWMELRGKIGRDGLKAEEYLIFNNLRKYLSLRAMMTLEQELLDLEERIEEFREQRRVAYRQPKNADFQTKRRHLTAYLHETEERVFQEFIVPFAQDE